MRFISLSIFVAFWSLLAIAALPPLSQEDRENNSSDIVEGLITVLDVSDNDRGDGFVDYVYRAEVKVEKVVKGDREVGESIPFSFWRMKERPWGWAGPGGQYGRVELNTIIRAYLIKDADGNYKLIEPNGVDNIPSELTINI